MVAILKSIVRARLIIAISFAVVATLVLVLLALKPNKYEAHMSFLVRNERADILVSTDPQQNTVQHGDVTEEDINSEVELLSSSELLQGVARACGLDSRYRDHNEQAALEKATRKLSKDLIVSPVRKSALINVVYTSTDRNQSVLVLNELARRYLSKHASLHTAGTAAAFFKQKSQSIGEELLRRQEQRSSLLQANGYSLLPEQRELSLQQMLDAKKSLNEVNASLAETSSRLKQVLSQQSESSPRLMTQDRVSANQYSVERLNTMLVDMKNKRTELATKFRPGDRLLIQADQEIEDTEASLRAAKERDSEDRTTDVNPVWLSLDTEAHRLKQAQSGLQSRKAELIGQLSMQRSDIGKMEQASIDIDELDRNIKELQASRDLYQNKAIAAGVAEDLDAAKISNVVVASPPMVPALPAPSPFNYFTGLLFAVLASLGIGLASESRSEKMYADSKIEEVTGIPVLTSFDLRV
jgi:succinoglycan biosynthesis transport protein ExoP